MFRVSRFMFYSSWSTSWRTRPRPEDSRSNNCKNRLFVTAFCLSKISTAIGIRWHLFFLVMYFMNRLTTHRFLLLMVVATSLQSHCFLLNREHIIETVLSWIIERQNKGEPRRCVTHRLNVHHDVDVTLLASLIWTRNQ